MKRQFKILVGDNVVKNTLMLTEHLRSCGYNVFCRKNDCDIIYSAVASIIPDALILNCENHNGDTEELIRKISDNFCEVRIIVISKSDRTDLSIDLINKGAFMFVPMPLSKFDILHCIEKSVSRCINLTRFQRRIISFMFQMGFPVYLKGCSYIACAVENALKSPSLINNITNKMYPVIAQQFGVSNAKVERSIRNVIDVILRKKTSSVLIDNVNPNIPFKSFTFTNSEMIVIIADIFFSENETDVKNYIDSLNDTSSD